MTSKALIPYAGSTLVGSPSHISNHLVPGYVQYGSCLIQAKIWNYVANCPRNTIQGKLGASAVAMVGALVGFAVFPLLVIEDIAFAAFLIYRNFRNSCPSAHVQYCVAELLVHSLVSVAEYILSSYMVGKVALGLILFFSMQTPEAVARKREQSFLKWSYEQEAMWIHGPSNIIEVKRLFPISQVPVEVWKKLKTTLPSDYEEAYTEIFQLYEGLRVPGQKVREPIPAWSCPQELVFVNTLCGNTVKRVLKASYFKDLPAMHEVEKKAYLAEILAIEDQSIAQSHWKQARAATMLVLHPDRAGNTPFAKEAAAVVNDVWNAVHG